MTSEEIKKLRGHHNSLTEQKKLIDELGQRYALIDGSVVYLLHDELK